MNSQKKNQKVFVFENLKAFEKEFVRIPPGEMFRLILGEFLKKFSKKKTLGKFLDLLL